MINNLNEIIEAFLKWYENDSHRLSEDAYPELKTSEFLSKLGKEEFIEYFFQFVKEGGKIQSDGHRFANQFKVAIINKFNEFREFALEPYVNDFNLDNWLNRVKDFDNFGKGSSTIYLNRVDKSKYLIVNNKSVQALKALGYNIKGNLTATYYAIELAQKDLLTRYPEIKNFYIADSLAHFIIGVDEGKNLLATYLKEKINYWVFQCNPNDWDLREHWDSSTKEDTWRVNAHKDKIKIDDKVILWMTGYFGLS